jgi:hypothetical protein
MPKCIVGWWGSNPALPLSYTSGTPKCVFLITIVNLFTHSTRAKHCSRIAETSRRKESTLSAGLWWLMPVNLATWEAEIRRIVI